MNLLAQRLGLGGSTFSMSPFSGTSEAKKSLGQDEQSWYSRARSGIAEYDNLWDRAQRIAPKSIREDLQQKWHGDPNNKDGALYDRNAVAYNLSQAEESVPVNYLVFSQRLVRNRVIRLENWNKDMKADVEDAEKTYGTISPTQIHETIVTVEKSGLPSWAVPAMVMGGLAIVGVLISKSIK